MSLLPAVEQDESLTIEQRDSLRSQFLAWAIHLLERALQPPTSTDPADLAARSVLKKAVSGDPDLTPLHGLPEWKKLFPLATEAETPQAEASEPKAPGEAK
jgi:hypothetical protein